VALLRGLFVFVLLGYDGTIREVEWVHGNLVYILFQHRILPLAV
jgi:hypothetical protein